MTMTIMTMMTPSVRPSVMWRLLLIFIGVIMSLTSTHGQGRDLRFTPRAHIVTYLSLTRSLTHPMYALSNGIVVTSISPTNYATQGGTTVTITGTSLTGATSVTYGPTGVEYTATTIVVQSSTRVLATTIAGSGSGLKWIVTTGSGSSSASSATT
jgi:hypothetical protein